MTKTSNTYRRSVRARRGKGFMRRLFFVLFTLVVFGFIASVITSYRQKASALQTQIDACYEAMEEEKRTMLALQSETRYLNSSTYRERQARNRLNLIREGEFIIEIRK